MPVLAAFFDFSTVSIAIENKDGDIEFFLFPYAYSKELFAGQCTEDEFYSQILASYLASKKLKLADFDVAVSGYLQPPFLPFKTALSVSFLELINSFSGSYPVFVNTFSVSTKDVLVCNTDIKSNEEGDFYSNLSIYPQLSHRDISFQNDIDCGLVSQFIDSGGIVASEAPIIFTGSRFAHLGTNKDLNYILSFDMLRIPGFYKLYLDNGNKALLVQLIKLLKKDFAQDLDSYLEPVGTYISTDGGMECLLNTDIGTGQFFDLQKNTLFILPQDIDTKVKLSVKNTHLGLVEGFVGGGTLGLIFDTRETKKSIFDDVKLLNLCLKQLKEILVEE